MPVSAGAANHYFDCEVLQFAMADMQRVDLLPEPKSEAPPQVPPAASAEQLARLEADRRRRERNLGTRTFRREYG